MTLSSVVISSSDAAFTGLFGEPAEPRGAAVVLLPEIYNLNGWIRDVADRYVASGHTVLVPDLFWRHDPRVDLPYTPEGQQRGRALSAALDRHLAAADIGEAARWLAQRTSGAPVGVVGFCLGGELAFVAAAQGVVDAASAYYPTRMDDHLPLAARIAVPLQVHIGELDHRTPPDLVARLRTALPARPDAEVFVYDGADHGFGRFGHPPFHPAAAALADTRTRELLRIALPRGDAPSRPSGTHTKDPAP